MLEWICLCSKTRCLRSEAMHGSRQDQDVRESRYSNSGIKAASRSRRREECATVWVKLWGRANGQTSEVLNFKVPWCWYPAAQRSSADNYFLPVINSSQWVMTPPLLCLSNYPTNTLKLQGRNVSIYSTLFRLPDASCIYSQRKGETRGSFTLSPMGHKLANVQI